MFLDILRISASNVLKTLLNIIVSIGYTFVVFHLHKPTGSINTPLLINRYESKLYMHNTSRETNYFHLSVQYRKIKVLRLSSASGMFLACS